MHNVLDVRYKGTVFYHCSQLRYKGAQSCAQINTSYRLETPWKRKITAPQAALSPLYSRLGLAVLGKACYPW